MYKEIRDKDFEMRTKMHRVRIRECKVGEWNIFSLVSRLESLSIDL